MNMEFATYLPLEAKLHCMVELPSTKIVATSHFSTSKELPKLLPEHSSLQLSITNIGFKNRLNLVNW